MRWLDRAHPRSSSSSPAMRAARYVTYGQLIFFVTVGVCVALLPRVAAHHGGLSRFDIHKATFVPYTLGLLLTAYFLMRAARALAGKTRTLRILTEALVALAALVVGVSLTPYSLSTLVDWAHVAASAALFFGELLLAFWLVLAHDRDRLNLVLLVILVVAAFAAFLSELGAADRLFGGELLAQAAFSVMLVRCLHHLSREAGPRQAAGRVDGARQRP